MTSLRVLCLHGYRQNGHMFREKTGSLRKLLKKQVTEFVYIDAPHVISAHENDHELDATSSSNRSNERGTPGALKPIARLCLNFIRGWWFSTADQTYDALAATSCDRGFEESIDYVLNYIREQQTPFDGLLAFSQGAAFATLLLARLASTTCPFRFVLLVASFPSGQTQHQAMYHNLRIDLPSLHVIGANDQVIPCQMSENLAKEYFTDAQVFRHDGGHFMPTSADAKSCYVQFLDRFL